jgi:hypothetical protein
MSQIETNIKPGVSASDEESSAVVLSAEERDAIWGTKKPDATAPTETQTARIESDDSEDNEDDDDDSINIKAITDLTPEEKSSTKLSDVSSVVQKLIDSELLLPFEDGKVETMEDLVELIKANKESWEQEYSEKFDEEFRSRYSPQVQSILDYAENGGQNIAPLMQMWASAERIAELDEAKPRDAEQIVRRYFELKGVYDSDEELNEQIDMLKDTNALQSKASKFKEKLLELEEDQINQAIEEQKERDAMAAKALQRYTTVVKGKLDSNNLLGIPLSKETKRHLYEMSLPNRYQTTSGMGTGFDKTLDDLRFGEQQDYEHFLALSWFATDKEGFLNHLRNEVKKDVTADTVRQLKTSKNANPVVNDGNRTTPITQRTIARRPQNPYK